MVIVAEVTPTGTVQVPDALKRSWFIVATLQVAVLVAPPPWIVVVIVVVVATAEEAVPFNTTVVFAVPAELAGFIVKPGEVVGTAVNAPPLIEACTDVIGVAPGV
jgi:hypothetical protein